MSDQRQCTVGRDVEPVDLGTDGISFAVSCRPKVASIARTLTRADLYFATKPRLPLGINTTAAASLRTSTSATDRTFAAAIDSTVTLRPPQFATRDKSPTFEIAMPQGYHPILTISIRRGGGVVRSMTCRRLSARAYQTASFWRISTELATKPRRPFGMIRRFVSGPYTALSRGRVLTRRECASSLTSMIPGYRFRSVRCSFHPARRGFCHRGRRA